MRNLIFAGVLAGLVAAQLDGGACTFAVELMLIQDGSGSFEPWIDEMKESMSDLVDDFSTRYEEFKFGVSSFVDKPFPQVGNGPYGGNVNAADYCYRLHASLTTDAKDLVTGLGDLRQNMGYGGDLVENPTEGLAYAVGDPNAGWTNTSIEYSPGGRPIVRIALLITDNVAHPEGRFRNGVDTFWNYPRSYDPVNVNNDTGGFGARTFEKYQVISQKRIDNGDYYAMCDLFRQFELWNLGTPGFAELSPEQYAKLDEYIDQMGPYPYPEPVAPPKNWDDSATYCGVAEYVNDVDLGKFLREKKVMTIILAVDNGGSHGKDMDDQCKAYGVKSDADCLAKYYNDKITSWGVPGMASSMVQGSVKERIVEAVSNTTEMLCRTSTSTTTLPSTTTTTSHSTTAATSSAAQKPDNSLSTIASQRPNNSLLTVAPVQPPVSVPPVVPTEGPGATGGVEASSDVSEGVEASTIASQRPNNSLLTVAPVQPPVSVLPVVPTEGPGGTVGVEASAGVSEGVEASTIASQRPNNSLLTVAPVQPPVSVLPVVPTEGPGATGGVEASAGVSEGVEASGDASEGVEASAGASEGAEASEGAQNTDNLESSGVGGESATTGQEFTTTGGAAVPPVVAEAGGASTGTIAGAAAGGVAGLAAVGGVLYKKFGASLFGHSPASPMDTVQQVEVPESPVERETMEEVTMDMFQ